MLESRTFFRVGGTQPIKVDVRVIAATNRPLREAVALGEFRDDLYYRLNVLNIYLPPLRERREDIPLLVRRFIRELARAHDRTFRGIAPEAMQRLVERALARQRPPAPEPDRVHGGAGAGRRDPGVRHPARRASTGRAGACCRSAWPRRSGRAPAARRGRSWSSSSGACSTSSSRSRSSAAGWTRVPSGSR